MEFEIHFVGRVPNKQADAFVERVRILPEQYAPDCIKSSLSDGSRSVLWTNEDEEIWQVYLCCQQKWEKKRL